MIRNVLTTQLKGEDVDLAPSKLCFVGVRTFVDGSLHVVAEKNINDVSKCDRGIFREIQRFLVALLETALKCSPEELRSRVTQ